MTNPVLLHRYLNADLISVQAPISSRKKLLQEMARLLASPLHETVEKEVYHLLLEREKIGNTGIGNGVALPHSRCAKTADAVVAIITIAEPLDYDSMDRQPVDLAIGLLVPESATDEHLGLLAAIARLLSDNDRKSQLCSAQSADQITALIQQWSEQPLAE